MTDRQTTHATGCWGWGPAHYECAVGRIERDEALLRQATDLIETLRDCANALGELLPRNHAYLKIVEQANRLAAVLEAAQAERDAMRNARGAESRRGQARRRVHKGQQQKRGSTQEKQMSRLCKQSHE